MNKLFNLLCCSLLLIVGLAACSADGDDPPEQPDSHQDEVPVDSIINPIDDSGSSAEYEVISTVPVSEEVKAFFDRELPYINSEMSPIPNGFTLHFNIDLFFSDYSKDPYRPALYPSCYPINSEEELRQIYTGEAPLPYIDFTNHTLIIGSGFYNGFSALSYLPMEVRAYKDRNELTMHVKTYSESFSYEFTYFWGLFPKIEGIFGYTNIIYYYDLDYYKQ